MEDTLNDQEQNGVNIDLSITPLNIYDALDDSPMFRQSVIEIEEVYNLIYVTDIQIYNSIPNARNS